ncbi:MAG TPA: hypothetical protein VFE65_33075 [Pseudonocardia sp.]|jgi:hypothetical protein|nr:hypothetical protein [Pseudonocardia sp.]
MADLLSDRERQTLIAVLRCAYPHKNFPDGPYERTADVVLEAARADPRTSAQLIQGLADLDRLRDAPFADLPHDHALALLRSVQDTPFFAAIIDTAVVALYNDHEVWEILGYEGASFDQGGYINRGYNDLDWLPDPRVSEADESGVNA